MLKETNMIKIKEKAIELLYVKPKMHETFSFIVYHPFFANAYVKNDLGTGPDMIDIFQDDESLELARQNLKKIIMSLNNAIELLIMTNKPYLPAMFKSIKDYLSDEDFAKVLRSVWQETEFPNHDCNFSVKEFHKEYLKAKKEYLMDKEELEILNNFNDEMTVYRGFYNNYYDALSWTLSKEKAKWFSERFSDTGTVYKATIKKEDIIAYYEDDEKEVIVDYEKLKDIVKI